MGFGREAARVADADLPMRYRLQALSSCITLAQPIGFNATWRYLELRTGTPWREPSFLMPALQLLKVERALHLEVADEYAAIRRAQKHTGHRFPPVQDVTPIAPRRWHGDEQQGALVTLRTALELDRYDESKSPAAQAQLTLRAAREAVNGNSEALDHHNLQSLLDWSRRQVNVVGWPSDREAYQAAWQNLRLLGQIHLLLYGATAVATPWNFVNPTAR